MVNKENGLLIKTVDGGQNWTQAGDTGLRGDHIALAFASETTGWAIGYKDKANQRQTSRSATAATSDGVVVKTQDGGVQWNQQPLPVKAELYGITCAGANNAWIAGYDGAARQGLLLQTTNGGLDWKVIHPGVNVPLKSIVFKGKYGWTVGGQTDNINRGAVGVILATTDAGENWQKQSGGEQTDLNAVTFTDENNGWAVGADVSGPVGVILATNDGGKTWHTQQNNVLGELSSIAFANAKTGWVIGRKGIYNTGVLLETEDGGETWKHPIEDLNLAPEAIAVTPDGTAVTIGSGQYLTAHKTHDFPRVTYFSSHPGPGGETLEFRMTPANSISLDVAFSTSLTELPRTISSALTQGQFHPHLEPGQFPRSGQHPTLLPHNAAGRRWHQICAVVTGVLYLQGMVGHPERLAKRRDHRWRNVSHLPWYLFADIVAAADPVY